MSVGLRGRKSLFGLFVPVALSSPPPSSLSLSPFFSLSLSLSRSVALSLSLSLSLALSPSLSLLCDDECRQRERDGFKGVGRDAERYYVQDPRSS